MKTKGKNPRKESLGKFSLARNALTPPLLFHKIRLRIVFCLQSSKMPRQKIKVYAKDGKEITDEWLRKRTLAANRIIRKQRIPKIEANIRRNRRALGEEVKNKPYIKGLKWNLGAHLREDICDKLATQDLYGLGPGCYPANAYPEIQHDNCHCWDSQIFDDNYFKNYTPSEEEMAAIKEDPKYPEFKKWAEDFLERTNSHHQKKEKIPLFRKIIGRIFSR
jgi:hypothetical protein